MKKENWRIKNLPKTQSGEKNSHWKGGIHYRKDGYILINMGPRSRTYHGARYKLQHRIVMEEKLGRPLLRSEIVHHIDGNTSNNNPDNLQIMTQSEHAKHDYELRIKNKLGQLMAQNKPLNELSTTDK
jgi:hypothetical protein